MAKVCASPFGSRLFTFHCMYKSVLFCGCYITNSTSKLKKGTDIDYYYPIDSQAHSWHFYMHDVSYSVRHAVQVACHHGDAKTNKLTKHDSMADPLITYYIMLISPRQALLLATIS